MSSSTEIPPLATNSESDGNQALIFTSVFLAIQTICVIARFVSRGISKAPWGLDDALIIVSFLMQIGLAVCTIGVPTIENPLANSNSGYTDSIVKGGLGHHLLWLEYNALDRLIRWQQDLFALEIIYLISINIPKIAILNLYYRIFIGVRTRIFIWVLGTILILYSVISTPILIFLCSPIRAYWDVRIKDAKCLNRDLFQTYSALPNIITDIAMLILPLPIIWKLQAPTRLKVGLSLTFLVAGLGLVASVLRFATFFKVDFDPDPSWQAGKLFITTLAESGCYLISACLPRCRPLLDVAANSSLLQSLKRTITNKSNGSASSVGNLGNLQPENGSSIQLRPQNTSAIQHLSITGNGHNFHRLAESQKSSIIVQKDFSQEDDVEKNAQ
ncbi:hypothetical protein NHQ30_010842 [Ciborinia camelliae]|nr:hypothetical protein NHQ30_010842 [Ciborinia camelliae]